MIAGLLGRMTQTPLSAKKAVFFWRNKLMLDKKYIKALFWIFALLIIIIFFYYNYDTNYLKDISISKFSTNKNSVYRNPLRNHKVILTKFHMSVDADNSIGFEIAIPYKTQKRRHQLSKYSKRIKSDFILNVSEENLKMWVEQRKYDDIKSKFIEIADKYLDEPVKDVYFNIFFYE